MNRSKLAHALTTVALLSACSSQNGSPPAAAEQGGHAGAPVSSAGANQAGKSSGGTAMSAGDGAGAASGGSPIAGAGAGAGGGGSGGTGGMGGPIVPVGETPEAKWVNITGNLAGMPSECGNLGRVVSHPYEDQLLVGVALKGLFDSRDGGQTWQPLGGSGATITNRISYVAFDPASPQVFWESGIYNGGGVYKTSDSGQSFTQLGDVTHSDSVSLDFSDPARQTLLAGSHEQAQKLFRSTDGGVTWQDIGGNLPAGSGFCTTSLILDNMTFLIGCGGWYGGAPGIHRSIDGGESFEPVSEVGVAGQPLRTADGTIYWAGHQAGGLYRSTDQGQTFIAVAAANEARSVEPIELPDGRIVTVGDTTLVVSADQGETWQPLADALPFTPNGVSYSAYRNAFYVWQWDCGEVVLADAIARFGYDYRQ
jgi:hypothetical protein